MQPQRVFRFACRGAVKKASATAWIVLVLRSHSDTIFPVTAPPQPMYRITCPSRASGGGQRLL
jgi:hypothetical protein